MGLTFLRQLTSFTEKQLQVFCCMVTRNQLMGNWSNGATMRMQNGWEGIIPQTMRLYHQTESEWRKGSY